MKEVKSVTSTWFEVKVKVERTNEDGLTALVKEAYCVDAISFTEAETRITKHLSDFVGEVVEEKIANYKEVLSRPDKEADKFYKCKIALLVQDKAKKTALYYLVNADNTAAAEKIVNDFYSNSTQIYEIVSIAETQVLELVVRHETR